MNALETLGVTRGDGIELLYDAITFYMAHLNKEAFDVDKAIKQAHRETHCTKCGTPLHNYEIEHGKCDACRYKEGYEASKLTEKGKNAPDDQATKLREDVANHKKEVLRRWLDKNNPEKMNYRINGTGDKELFHLEGITYVLYKVDENDQVTVL